MHDDFYKMTGCMHAVSVYFMTRRKDGSPQTSPNRVIQIRAAKLNSIASALLQISFDMEAKENVFQKLWGAEKANVNNAIDGVHTAAGAASHMPPPRDLRRRILSDTFSRAAANPGDGADGHAFLNALYIAVQDTEKEFLMTSHTPAETSRFNVALKKLNGVLNILRQAQEGYYLAFSTMRNSLGAQAQEFVDLYPRLTTQVMPWSSMDERLRQLMTFMERSAKNGIGGGPGGDTTPSWGGVATSGSSSSSSSSGGA